MFNILHRTTSTTESHIFSLNFLLRVMSLSAAILYRLIPLKFRILLLRFHLIHVCFSPSVSSSTDAVYSCWPEKSFLHQEGLLGFSICWVNIRSKCAMCMSTSYAILNYYMDHNLRQQSRTQSSSCSSVPACSSMQSVPFIPTVSLRCSCLLHRPIIILWESSYQWKNNK